MLALGSLGGVIPPSNSQQYRSPARFQPYGHPAGQGQDPGILIF